jgi:solute carrier family 25 carnitine/acylcarnitine transporter 20/29
MHCLSGVRGDKTGADSQAAHVPNRACQGESESRSQLESQSGAEAEPVCTGGAAPYLWRLGTWDFANQQIRQQSMPTDMNPSAWQVTKDILRQGGLRGLYRGFSATWWRELAYGPYFWS